MRLKHKFVHTNTHGGKKSTHRKPTCVMHTCAFNTHSRVAKAANKQVASGCFSDSKLEPCMHATASFFFEQHIFLRDAKCPFHAGTRKPADIASIISLYLENDVLLNIVFVVASELTKFSMFTTSHSSREKDIRALTTYKPQEKYITGGMSGLTGQCVSVMMDL